uniref:Uncharacterized protein n=1 Tax=Archaeoglobus fulgidus TaxID=2234 RepID=A0A7C2S6C5_ARCFL
MSKSSMSKNPVNEIVSELDKFYLNFPREIGWKTQQGFIRNRYVSRADQLAQKLENIQQDFFASVYSFDCKYRDGRQWDRNSAVINRMFFDFDCPEDPKAALKEAKKLIRELSVAPLVTFSGAKGFHVHVVFRRVAIRPETLKMFGTRIAERLKLKTCDTQVFEVARLSRVPFSLHSKSGLPCTPIRASRLLKMTFDDVLRFVKRGQWDPAEPELDRDFAETIEIADYMFHEEEKRELQKLPKPLEAMMENKAIKGRKARIEYYLKVLRVHGRLSADERIREIHLKSPWIARHGANEGAVEHIARVHLILMMIEEGWTDEQIHAAFKLAKDYDPKRTQYYIDYNRKWVEKRKEKPES